MKKKIFMPLIVVAAVAMGYVGYGVYETQAEDNSLLFENVEALANGENDCHYTNGYAAFTGDAGGAYDCCKVWVNQAPNTSQGHCR